MARAHDGLMMLLTVGRNHTLRLVVFYDGWLSFMMDVISFMMMDVSCMVDGFIYFIALVSWNSMRKMYLYFYICIFF